MAHQRSKIHFVREPGLLIDEIKQALQPISDKLDLAIIFGSLANNNFLIHSDVDLLIVSDEVELQTIRDKLDPFLTDNGIYYDLLFMTFTEFEKKKVLPVIQEALGGVVLWENEKIEFMPQNNT